MIDRQKIINLLGEEDKYGTVKIMPEPEKKVWFCVVYNAPRDHDDWNSRKNYARRILNGEKIKGASDKNVEVTFGYGKHVAMRHPANHYIVYDCNFLKGNHRKSNDYHIFHETWIKLGEWVKENCLKEKVIFT